MNLMALDEERRSLRACIFEAFPVEPRPVVAPDNRSTFSRLATGYLSGKTWQQASGWKLYDDEMLAGYSLWYETLPLNIVAYYLPGHLLYAVERLAENPELAFQDMYCGGVVDALILPPESEQELKELEYELCIEASIERTSKERVALYNVMTPAQRRCIARFLDLYLHYTESSFGRRGIELYKKNQALWAGPAY